MFFRRDATLGDASYGGDFRSGKYEKIQYYNLLKLGSGM